MSISATKIIKREEEIPVIELPIEVFQKMSALVRNSNEEIGWLALCKKEANSYNIYEVTICDQEVSETTVELDEKGIQKIAEELISTNREDEMNNVRCWGHSHVDMPVSPSGQDDKTFEEYYKQCGDYFIRLIMNRKGEYYIDLADYEEGVIYKNLKLTFIYPENEFQLMKAIDELERKIEELKVEKKKIESERLTEINKDAVALIKAHVKKEEWGYYTGSRHTAYKDSRFEDDKVIEKDDEKKEAFLDEDEIDWVLRLEDTGDDLHIKVSKGTKFISDVLYTDEIYYVANEPTAKVASKFGIYPDFRDYNFEDWKHLKYAAEWYLNEYEHVATYYYEEAN